MDEQEGQRRKRPLGSKCQPSHCQGGSRGWGERSKCCCFCRVFPELLRGLKSAGSVGNDQEHRPRCPVPCQVLVEVSLRSNKNSLFQSTGPVPVPQAVISWGFRSVTGQWHAEGWIRALASGAGGGLLTLGQKW